jgi:hypothetical protein
VLLQPCLSVEGDTVSRSSIVLLHISSSDKCITHSASLTMVAFNAWNAGEWLEKHSSVSVEEFAKDPSRNRFSVVLNQTAHMAFHLGQAALVKLPR